MTTDADTVRPLQYSLSAHGLWQTCEQAYAYRYIERLRVKEQFPAPVLGRVLHSYVENYFRLVQSGEKAEDAHLQAKLLTSNEYMPILRGYGNVAHAAGSDEVAKTMFEMMPKAGRIADRYFETHGCEDSQRYKIIAVERRLRLRLARAAGSLPPIISEGVIDLVTQDTITGRISIWEHKSTTTVPPDSVRIRDFQTMLYALKLRYQDGTIVDSVVWDYLRTKEPTVPELVYKGTKREALSKRADIDSTWPIYAAEIDRHGLDPADYADMRERLEDRETTIFFPRFEQVIVVNEELLMRDYVVEAKRVRAVRRLWEQGRVKPVRTLSRNCENCEFFPLTRAALTGGDEEDVIKMRYDRGGRRE